MIKRLTYNWKQTGDLQSGLGEDYETAEVGVIDTKNKLEVKEILEHKAAGEGDKWYYDIVYTNGTEMRVFNPNTVFRKTDKSVF